MFLNLIGNVIVIATTQLIIFPLLSRYFNQSVFGSVTSIYGINTVVVVLTGDALANVRIIRNNKSGANFNVIAFYDSFLLSLIVSLLLFFIYGRQLSVFDKINFSITTSIMSFLEYGVSIYRIESKYDLYLYQNIIVSFGYVIGIIFFFMFHRWSLIFFIGNVVAVFFFIYKSSISNEKWTINFKLKNIIMSLINISIGHVFSSITANLDRFLIPILLGYTYLSIFFVANTLSKMFGLIIGPLSSILLSYMSKLNVDWNKDKLNKLTFHILILSILLIIPSYFISEIFIRILYNNIFISYSYIRIIIIMSCIATCLFEAWNVINTVYLTCLKSNFQIVINAMFFICYVCCSMLFSHYMGLIGYSFGYALSIILSFIISIFLSNKSIFWKKDG